MYFRSFFQEFKRRGKAVFLRLPLRCGISTPLIREKPDQKEVLPFEIQKKEKEKGRGGRTLYF